MGTSRPETYILDQKYIELTRKNQEPTRKCAIYPNMDRNTWTRPETLKNRKNLGINGYEKNGPEPTRTRQDPTRNRPEFFKVPMWVQNSRTRKTRTRKDPTRTRPEDPDAQA